MYLFNHYSECLSGYFNCIKLPASIFMYLACLYHGSIIQIPMDVFIVEDSAIMLENLLATLPGIPGVAVIGHAVDESGAIERIDALRPDVVTLDLRLRSGSGFGVPEYIKKHHTGI